MGMAMSSESAWLMSCASSWASSWGSAHCPVVRHFMHATHGWKSRWLIVSRLTEAPAAMAPRSASSRSVATLPPSRGDAMMERTKWELSCCMGCI